jgi:hypothetical protein
MAGWHIEIPSPRRDTGLVNAAYTSLNRIVAHSSVRLAVRALSKVLALSVVLTLALASAALADEVTNRIDTVPDPSLEGVGVNEGATQSVTFRVIQKSQDNDSGCNIDAGEQLTIEVVSSDTSVATVSPQTLTFTGCNQDQSVTVTGGARGMATITAAQAPGAGSNTTGGGSYDYAPASFTATVNNVAPTISNIADQNTNEDTAAGPIAFTVNDPSTPDNLTVTGSSSNTALVPDGNITLLGSGTNRTITVRPVLDQSGTATITVSVSDGAATTSDTFNFTVNAVNDAPNIGSVTNDGPINEGSSATITVAAADPEGDSLSYEFDCNNDNAFEVGPQPGSTARCAFANDGTRRVNVRLTDSNGSASTGSTNITVNNVAPDAVDDSASAEEDGLDVTINVLANDTDVPADSLTITGNTQPPTGEGSVSCSASNCTFAPDADFNGTTSFQYTMSDAGGGTDTAAVTVTVNATSDAPTADAQAGTTNEDSAKTIALTGSDADGDALTFEVTSAPTKGTLGAVGAVTCAGTKSKICQADVNYTPNANFNGTDSFQYTVGDGRYGTDTATVNISVNAVNDTPSFTKGTDQTVQEDAGVQSILNWATGISSGPADESAQAVSFTVTSNNEALFTAEGQPAVSSDGALTFTSATNASGTANVEVVVQDDGGTANGGSDTSGLQTFTITVNAVNDAPTVTLGGDGPVNEGRSKTFDFAVNDPDSADTFTVKSGFPDCGTYGSLVAGSLSTAPGSFRCRFPDGPATSTVRVQVVDGQGTDSNVSARSAAVANGAPSIRLTGSATANEGDTKAYSYAVIDSGDDEHTTDTACGTNGVKVAGSDTYDSATGEGGFQCRFVDGPMTTQVRATATDSDGARDADYQVVEVQVSNVAPTVELSGPATANEGQTKTYTYTVRDPGDDPAPTITESCGANGTRIDTPAADSFECAFPHGPASSTVEVTATDSDSDSGSDEISVEVADLIPPDTTTPTVIKVAPTGKKVSPSANVVATFSEAMMRSSLNGASVKLLKKGTTKAVAATLSYPAANKVVLNPKHSLVRGAIYTVTIVGGTSGAKDVAGNALEVGKVWTFRVRS